MFMSPQVNVTEVFEPDVQVSAVNSVTVTVVVLTMFTFFAALAYVRATCVHPATQASTD